MIPGIDTSLLMFLGLGAVFTVARHWPGVHRCTPIVQRLAFDVLMPVLLFHTLATTELPAFDGRLFTSYYLPTLVVYALVVVGTRSSRGSPGGPSEPSASPTQGDRNPQTIAISSRINLALGNVLGLAATYSNAVLLGIPLAASVLPPAGAITFFLLVALHSPVLFFLTSVLDSLARSQQVRMGELRTIALAATGRLIKNPILIALALGFAVAASDLALPSDLIAATGFLRLFAAPLALLAMGLGLAHYGSRTINPATLWLSGAKLLLHPGLVALLALGVMQLPLLTAAPAILMAALPTGVNVYLFATRFDAGVPTVAGTVLLSTMICPASIAALLWAFSWLG